MLFKDYFEDEEYLKCWHNYGYDRHILFNHGIDCRGFGGDTMHMARLCDPSRMPNQYALATLSDILIEEIEENKQDILQAYRTLGDAKANATIDIYEQYCRKTKKINIVQTFGFYRQLKTGSSGKILMFPDIEEMHTNPKYIEKWVEYSCFDAEITYFLRELLSRQLCQLKTEEEGMGDNLTLYTKYWLPFGELLTDMERVGIAVDVEYLRELQLRAKKDRIEHEDKFTKWV